MKTVTRAGRVDSYSFIYSFLQKLYVEPFLSASSNSKHLGKCSVQETSLCPHGAQILEQEDRQTEQWPRSTNKWEGDSECVQGGWMLTF